MLSNPFFYNGTIRKIIEAFGSIFTGIQIVRFDNTGTPVKTILVPCEYGPKEKWMSRNLQQKTPGKDDQVAMILPRISYELVGLNPDPSRQLTGIGRTVGIVTGQNHQLNYSYNPVAYNLNFEVYIQTKTLNDLYSTLEPVLYFFKPEYTVTVKDIPALNLEKDISFVLGNVQLNDSWNGSMTDQREITATLNFTAKSYIYGPVINATTGIITQAIVNIGTENGLVNPSVVANLDPSDATADEEFTIIDTIESPIQ